MLWHGGQCCTIVMAGLMPAFKFTVSHLCEAILGACHNICGGLTPLPLGCLQTLSKEGLAGLGPTVAHMAALEGLDAHKRAVTLRLEALEKDS